MPGKLELGTFTPTTEAQLWKPNAAGAVSGTGQDDKVSLAILQHLLHDHLGQHSSAPFSLHAAQHLAPTTPSSPHRASEALLSSSKDSASPLSSWSSSKKRKSSDTSSGGAYCSETEKLFCRWQGCSAQFDSHSALTDHIETAHVGSGKAEYECRWIGCPRHASGQKFSQKQKVLRHIQTHTGDRPFKCTQCGKRFSEQNTLAQHIRTHTLERPYVCDHPGCGKAFSVAGSLTIHKRIHTGSKPFVCTFPGCGKAFAESSNLTKHVRTHTGDRPFRHHPSLSPLPHSPIDHPYTIPTGSNCIRRSTMFRSAPLLRSTLARASAGRPIPRAFSTTSSRHLPSDDPGGKPNTGQHRTVYDDFFNILESPAASSTSPLNAGSTVVISSTSPTSLTLSDGLVLSEPVVVLNNSVFLFDSPPLSADRATPSGLGWESWLGVTTIKPGKMEVTQKVKDVFKLFELVDDRPEILLFGTGSRVLPPPQPIRQHINDLGIQLDVMSTHDAASTFNMLSEEGRKVAAILLPEVEEGKRRRYSPEQLQRLLEGK
ncbi:hypothetical protein PHSY_003224 [Pseudozyma hubeiensis SY62]|uniref:C2H2-type domain-containing protein n=1 Tax=Pseudozyma hubeiensis (strain SY62) TaxID=1305764 RepID=R9P2L5_PSEHS|nr:hypothetical protein PHSY_003224 [Pseudozyma hubeiensis SY62]GAC95648.1 hypothetical protein PHSY_003224 [Pseudozyma hubeiensis SY62]